MPNANKLIMDTATITFSTGIFAVDSADVLDEMGPYDIVTTEINSSNTDCVICNYDLSPAMKSIRIVVGVYIVVTNGLMVVAVVRARNLNLALKALLCNLSIADALMGLAFTYLTAVVDIWTRLTLECRVRYGSLSYLQTVILYSILIFGLEKVATLSRPMRPQLVTTRKMVVAISLVWVFPLITTAVAYEMRSSHVTECYFGRFTGTDAFLIFASINVIAVIIVVICQIIIFVIAKIQVNKIAPTIIGAEYRSAQTTRMNMRIAITTLVIVAPFLLCSTPLLAGFLHLAINPKDRESKNYLDIITIEFLLAIINSALDPVIFTIQIRTVRYEVKRIVRTLCLGKVFTHLEEPEHTTSIV